MIESPIDVNDLDTAVATTESRPRASRKRSLKAVFVTHSLPRVGGAEQVQYDLIRGLSQYGIDPVLCCLYELGEFGERLRDEGVETYENVIGRCYDPRNVFSIKRVLQKEQAEIMFSIDSFHDTLLGYFASRLAGVTTVMGSHVFGELFSKAQKTGLARRLVLSAADRVTHSGFDCVIALDENHKRYLAEAKGVPLHRMKIVPNGIDQERFSVSISKSDARQQFGLPTDKPIVGIVASLSLCKKHDLFLRTAVAVLKQVPDAVFAIAGQGPERQNLESLGEELGIQDKVLFLGQVADVPTFLRSLDVSVLTSESEAFPLALLESMAAGLPVVTSDVGCIPAIVGEGETGYRVKFGDVEPFADRISQLLNDPALARKLGVNGRQRLNENFTLDHMVRNTASVFFDLVKGREE